MKVLNYQKVFSVVSILHVILINWSIYLSISAPAQVQPVPFEGYQHRPGLRWCHEVHRKLIPGLHYLQLVLVCPAGQVTNVEKPEGEAHFWVLICLKFTIYNGLDG